MSKRPAQQSLARSRSLNSLVNEQENEAYKGAARKRDDESASEEAKRFKENEQSGEHKTLSFNIPRNPYIWMENDVGQWLQWLSHHFGLPDIDLEKFKMSGKELCELRMEDFIERTHEYMGDIVYEYLCKFKEGCALQPKMGQTEEALKQFGGLYSQKDALNLAALQRSVRLQDGSQVASPTNTQSILPALIQNSGLQGYYTGGATLAAWPPYNLAISPVYTNAQTSVAGQKLEGLKESPDFHAALLQEKGATSVSSPLLSQALETFAQAVGPKNGVKTEEKTPTRGRGRGSGRGKKTSTPGRGRKLLETPLPLGGVDATVNSMGSTAHSSGTHTEVTKLTAGESVSVWSNPVMTDLQTMETLSSPSKVSADLSLLPTGSPLSMSKSPLQQQSVSIMKRIPAKDIRKTLEFVRPSDPPTFDTTMDLTSMLVNLMAILREKMKSSHETIARIQGISNDDAVQYQQRTGSPELWSFLLDLLTEEKHYGIIRWVNKKGEFVLLNKEDVSTLWGKAKNKDDMNYDKLSRALRYYYESKYKAFKNFGIMQKGEEASIKYNYRFTEAGLAKLCHHIGWEHVRRYTLPESVKGLENLQSVYLQKMKSPNPKGGIPPKVPQAQKVLPAEVAGTIPSLLLNTLAHGKDVESTEVGTASTEQTVSTPNLLSEAAAQALESATSSSSSSLPLLLNINPALLHGMLGGMPIASSGSLIPPMSPATLQAIAGALYTTQTPGGGTSTSAQDQPPITSIVKPEDSIMVTMPVSSSPTLNASSEA